MRFFFYGTLMQGGCNPVARRLHRRLGAGVPATVLGRLYALPDPAGWYPALLRDPAGAPVHGMMYDAGADFTCEDLAALDAYENFDPANLAESEYVRQSVPALIDSGGMIADAYLYHAPLPAGARPIPGGDFRAFLGAEGLPEYREPGAGIG
jgi:gamma-glutamylcyclotransferase (GGCT)/AIG2-like uncharacterized protein YtfP